MTFTGLGQAHALKHCKFYQVVEISEVGSGDFGSVDAQVTYSSSLLAWLDFPLSFACLQKRCAHGGRALLWASLSRRRGKECLMQAGESMLRNIAPTSI